MATDHSYQGFLESFDMLTSGLNPRGSFVGFVDWAFGHLTETRSVEADATYAKLLDQLATSVHEGGHDLFSIDLLGRLYVDRCWKPSIDPVYTPSFDPKRNLKKLNLDDPDIPQHILKQDCGSGDYFIQLAMLGGKRHFFYGTEHIMTRAKMTGVNMAIHGLNSEIVLVKKGRPILVFTTQQHTQSITLSERTGSWFKDCGALDRPDPKPFPKSGDTEGQQLGLF